MSLLWTVLTVSSSLLVTPLLMFLLAIIFLASIGKSLGVRRLYVKILLKIFEIQKRLYRLRLVHLKKTLPLLRARILEICPSPRYGRQHIEIAQKQNGVAVIEDDDDKSNHSSADNNCNNVGNHKLTNGFIPKDDNIVIKRNDLILAPDPELNHNGNHNGNHVADEAEIARSLPRRPSFETFKREFKLADNLDYIKAGVEAIIEDQVTHRFEAEELRSWNLLTRTNRQYEFVSLRLTVIWVLGFFMRYFFLLPLRVTICFVGMVWMSATSLLLCTLPDGPVKRWLYGRAVLVTFRILARSLSVVITIHDRHYQPSKGGVCVANHTTPVDIVILHTENIFSLVMWLTICTGIVGYLKEGPFKRYVNRIVSIMCFGVLSSALSSVITYHNSENRPLRGICVANHTSPIDVLVLACDNLYSLIGQRHGGFLGILQRALARASPHIWFERSEIKDREAVAKRLKQHVSDPQNPPILIFPEGTCINNTSVMQFKKGSFEVGGVIYPVAIKYDPKFGDAFWNSSRYSMMQYLYMMMSSWAIVCDVWYLPPMYQHDGESAIDFANRVKAVIARQGGLVDLMWDGQLKRMKPKKELREKQQEEFSKRLKLE